LKLSQHLQRGTKPRHLVRHHKYRQVCLQTIEQLVQGFAVGPFQVLVGTK
jgi:hypothetical protein